MECALVVCALWTISDCAYQRIGGWLMLLSLLAGSLAAAARIAAGVDAWHSLMPALLPGVILALFAFLAEGKIGRADGEMLAVLGLLLGWERCAAAACAAFLMIAAYAGAGLALGKLSGKSRVPFAPFLLAGTALVMIAELGSAAL